MLKSTGSVQLTKELWIRVEIDWLQAVDKGVADPDWDWLDLEGLQRGCGSGLRLTGSGCLSKVLGIRIKIHWFAKPDCCQRCCGSRLKLIWCGRLTEGSGLRIIGFGLFYGCYGSGLRLLVPGGWQRCWRFRLKLIGSGWLAKGFPIWVESYLFRTIDIGVAGPGKGSFGSGVILTGARLLTKVLQI